MQTGEELRALSEMKGERSLYFDKFIYVCF